MANLPDVLNVPDVKAAFGAKHDVVDLRSRRPCYTPTAESAAKGKALINFLMEDKFFLARFRSTDPEVRAGAMKRLEEAHYQAYGDAPVSRR